MPFTYILRCSDDSYYVGSTWDLDRRIWEHNEGRGARYTSHRRPVTLVWSEEFASVIDAYLLEKRIQNWSRAKREALINHDLEALPRLAKKNFSRRRSDEAGESAD